MTAGEPAGAPSLGTTRPAIRTVARTAALLNALHEKGGKAKLADLGAALTIPRSSLHDLVRPLIAAGWLTRAPNGALTFGPEIPAIGRGALSLPRLPDIEHALQEAADACRGTVVLCALDGGETVALAARAAADGPRAQIRAGDRWPPNWTLAGQILASDMTGRHLHFFLSAYARRRPGHASRSLDDDAAAITRLHGQSIATRSGEPEPHLTTCAIALRWNGTVKTVVAAIVEPERTALARRALGRLDMPLDAASS